MDSEQFVGQITRAMIETSGVGEINVDEAMRIINANHAQRALSADEVYLGQMLISTQRMDSYYTRMDGSSLNNFRDDFTSGLALMNSHRAGGRGPSELPLGRTYAAQVVGVPLSQDAPANAPGAATRVSYYIQRGMKLTDISTDDTIKGIEGGTIRDVSVGFTMFPNGVYRCSICQRDMLAYDPDEPDNNCPHLPGLSYDGNTAYAWVENAHAREASLVYKGATPGAMLEKATRLHDAGQLARRDTQLLESNWGVRIVGGNMFAVPTRLIKNEESMKPEAKNTGAAEQDNAAEALGDVVATLAVDWSRIIADAAETITADLRAKLDQAKDDSARVGLLIETIKGDLQQIADLRAERDALKPRAEMGDLYRADLIEQAVKARVRAQGAATFDADKYRAMLVKADDLDFVRSEIEAHDKAAKELLGTGRRPTDEAEESSAKSEVDLVPDSMYR